MPTFEDNIIAIGGGAGRRWLARLPALVRALAQRWRLDDVQPFADLSYNFVSAARRGATPVVLKIALDPADARREARALRALPPGACVAWLASDLPRGALLLERAVPGTRPAALFPRDDVTATHIAARVMRRLHVHVRRGRFPTGTAHLRDWMAQLDDDLPLPLPRQLLHRARSLARALLDSTPREVLLHGDLHHDNILAHGRGWRAIDPKGVIGDPAYDTAAFLYNPIPALAAQRDPARLIRARIAAFTSVLRLDAQRIRDWGFVQLVLSAVWSLADGQDPAYIRRVLEHYPG